ncbi:MAG: hypothetical protein ACKVN9_00110 [Methylophilaceae bacterium]
MQTAHIAPKTPPVDYLPQVLPYSLLASNDSSQDYVENAEFIRTVFEQALLAKNISVFCDCV